MKIWKLELAYQDPAQKYAPRSSSPLPPPASAASSAAVAAADDDDQSVCRHGILRNPISY
jgi:hypothetical protein